MGRLPTFVAGMLVGGLLVFVSLKFHIVRARDGYHMIPKLQADFASAYVDIRRYTLADWQKHPGLAAAITRSDKAYLLIDAPIHSLRELAREREIERRE